MPGPAPKRDSERRRTNKPVTGWNKTEKSGWQHGKTPPVPRGLTDAGKKAWKLWFQSWWASWWTPEDVPVLELAVLLYDRSCTGDAASVSKFQALADSLGLTPKGRYSLRLLPPDGEEEETGELASVRRLRVTDAAS